MSSFTIKNLIATFTLAQGTFGATQGNQVTVKNLRIVADIQKAGGMAMGTATIKVYGMKLSDMQQLTQLAFHPLEIRNNTVDIFAQDGASTPALVYSGTILNAAPDFSESPDVFLRVEAMAGYFNKINPVPPLSFVGAADVGTIMQKLALQMGYSFENNGVNTSLSNQYLANTAFEQMQEVADNANIDYYLDDKTLAICPKGQARKTSNVPLISANSEMVGYPSFDKMGVSVVCLYTPAIKFGGLVKIQSDVQPACGTWRVASIGHLLESQKPDGHWFSKLFVTNNALVVPS